MRTAVLVVAYNAESTLRGVLDRIPPAFAKDIELVLVLDDHSSDSTYEVGENYRLDHASFPMVVLRHPRNLGYGGNQKAGYTWLAEKGIELVVMLHGDGQYAPEFLLEMTDPIVRGRAEMVMGSRFMIPGGARTGGMPYYKFVGNRLLTRAQNQLTGLALSEWHSGYRAFNLQALRSVPLDSLSDGFDFDTQIILEMAKAKNRIVEIPIPTFYGDEVCHVNGTKYASQIMSHTLRFWARQRKETSLNRRVVELPSRSAGAVINVRESDESISRTA